MISFLNFAEPVTFVRSPTFTKLLPLYTSSGSSPLNLGMSDITGGTLGLNFFVTSYMALICSGVVPQQPPTIFRRSSFRNSSICFAVDSGVSSYSPNSFGSPAFGCALIRRSDFSAIVEICGRSCFAPSAQLNPMLSSSR